MWLLLQALHLSRSFNSFKYTEDKNMRPLTITVLCIVLFGIGISLAIRSLSTFFMSPGFYTFFMIILSFAGIYCYFGLWNMKRWCIPLFFCIWIIIPFPMFMGSDSYSTITMLRILYFIALLTVFAVVVLPHKDKFQKGSIWDFRSNIGKISLNIKDPDVE